MLDALVIAPHPDDAELGLAGTILRMQADGMKVGILDLTNGEPTPHGDRATRARETAAATKLLGVAWRENLGLANRRLEATLEARAQVANVIRRTRPRWLFAPYWEDAHPDHVAATPLVEAARFWAKLTKSELEGVPHHPERVFHYLCVHLRVVVQPAVVVDISPYWPQKQAILECYQSQFITGRPTGEPTIIDRMRDMAAYWGWTIGRRYGEALCSRETIGLESLQGLV